MGANVPTMVWGTAGFSTDPVTTQSNHEANEVGGLNFYCNAAQLTTLLWNQPFLRWMMVLAGDKCPPAMISSSYADNEDSATPKYAQRCNVEFQKVQTAFVTPSTIYVVPLSPGWSAGDFYHFCKWRRGCGLGLA
jgi:hypothetical protein